jgi:DoxX-like protein
MSNEFKVSEARLWTARVIEWLVAAFLIFDGVTKVMQVAPVRQAFADMGYAEYLAPRLGAVLLICVAFYLIPATSILGAVLLTAWFGGAIDSQVHALHPVFDTVFPMVFGVLAWLSLYLRNPRLGMLLPLRLDQAN